MRRDRVQFVEGVLNEYRSVTMKELLNLVPPREPRHYLYDLVAAYPKRAGKGLRPALCIATCRAFKGDTAAAMNSAVAIELLHNAFLVHDDVEDGSLFRRGLPTLHSEQGLAIAVNVGDAMNVLSIRALMRNLEGLGPALAWEVFAEIEHMVGQCVEGQAMELGWIRDNVLDLSEEDYLRMNLKKTCWYTCIHPCRIGAMIGSGGSAELDRFNRFGYYMGAAFQIQDDVLNLVGDRRKYGKEIGGDIWEGKRTLILIHMLNRCSPFEKRRIRRFLALPRGDRTAREVRRILALMEELGSVDYARSMARQLAGAALREFFLAYAVAEESEHKAFVRDIVFYMVDREF